MASETADDGWAPVKPTKQQSKRKLLSRQKSNASVSSVNSAVSTNSKANHSNASNRHHQKSFASKRSNSFSAPKRSNSKSFQRSGSNRSLGKQTTIPPMQKSNSFRRSRTRPMEAITLWTTTGSGDTKAMQEVIRWSPDILLARRLKYLEVPEDASFAPHERYQWPHSDDRTAKLEHYHKMFCDFKPLEHSADRWKPKHLRDNEQQQQQQQSLESTLSKLQSILNKLSWTNLDKLTLQFLETLGTETTIPKYMLESSLRLVTKKACLEPHFGSLYGRLSVKLASVHKAFKKTLLVLCQKQFDELSASEEDMKKETIQKKQLIGLCKFIGELYCQKIIKGGIMIGCCNHLLSSLTDEKKLEAAAQLLTIVGEGIDKDENLDSSALWHRLETVTLQVPTQRIRFLLQAIIELKEMNWVNVRHQHESATTIAQIHAKALEESKHGPVVATSAQKLKRSQSSDQIPRSRSKSPATPPPRSPMRRVQSEAPGQRSLHSSLQSAAAAAMLSQSPVKSSLQAAARLPQRSPRKSVDTTRVESLSKSAFKEFLVHEDTQEVKLCVSEIVAPDKETIAPIVVSAGIMLILEAKEEQVKKFIGAISVLLEDEVISMQHCLKGLGHPTEQLRDIEIDAPRASSFLSMVLASWLEHKSSLKEICHSFATSFLAEGNPGELAARILKYRNGDPSNDEIEVVRSLMGTTATVETARALIAKEHK